MRKYLYILTFATVFAAGCAIAVKRADRTLPFISYKVAMKDAALRTVSVNGAVRAGTAPDTRLTLPDPGDGPPLAPINLEARDTSGNPLAVEKDGQDWIVHNGRRDFDYSYDVLLGAGYGYSADVRGMLSMIETDRCRIMGRDVFVVPDQPVSNGILADIRLMPDSRIASAWKTVRDRVIIESSSDVASTMVVAGDYRILRSPPGPGDFKLAIAGSWKFSDRQLLDVISAIVSKEISMFGSSPRPRYLFVCDANPVKGIKGFDFYGVHSGGTVIMLMDRSMDSSRLYDAQMSIVSHEFFHTWNGDLLRPASDDFMWFTEGATVYYSYKVLADTGIISAGQYASRRQAILKRFRDNPLLKSYSVAQTANSDLADKDMVNMFYDGGLFAAESLDEKVREVSSGRIGLIDVIRRMYEENPNGAEIGQQYLVSTIMSMTGSDLGLFIDSMVRSRPPAIPSIDDVSS